MRDYFESLAAHADSLARPAEIVISRFSAEESDFLRFTKSAVRQAIYSSRLYASLEPFSPETNGGARLSSSELNSSTAFWNST